MPSSQTPPQHILIVTSGLGAGGAEQVIAQLAHHLARPVKRIFEKQLVDAPHQRQILCALALC